MKTILKSYEVFNNSESRKMRCHYSRKNKHKQSYYFKSNVIKVEKRWLVHNPHIVVAGM